MKLDCILTACNTNEMYIDFIPIFIKAWSKLYPKVDIKIVLIHKTIPEKFKKYEENIILFEPLQDVSTSFTSQYIRLLYPCILNYKNGIMITDIDMLPMNSVYYTENIKNFSDDKFIFLRQACIKEYQQIAMCYNVALNKTWQSVFNIKTIEDIKERLLFVSKHTKYVEGHGEQGWCTDQIHFYKYMSLWNSITNNFICLPDSKTGYNRLDKNTFVLNEKILNLIKKGFFSDYHCYRPYEKYKEMNDKIVNALPSL